MRDDRLMLWRSEDGARWFLFPVALPLGYGGVTLRSFDGETTTADARWLAMFEVDERAARDWAEGELGETLDVLKLGIDEALAAARTRLDEARRTPVAEQSYITPDAVPALFALLKSLPGVIGNSLSAQSERVETAKGAAADLERRLREAGIDLGDRLAAFPDRLAGLRGDLSAGRREGSGRRP